MRLTVLGCSGSAPGPDSACSSYLLEADGFRLLLDAGNGALTRLQRHCRLDEVDAVVITHLHADHCLDLVPYAVALRYAVARRARLPVLGPSGTGERIAAAYLTDPGEGLEDVFDHTVLNAGRRTLGPFTLTAGMMEHPLETYGVRLESAGAVFAYSADTGPCQALVDLADGAGTLLCEASFADSPDNPTGLHLSGRQAGEHAARAGVERLLLTHLTPWADEGRIAAEAATAFAGRHEVVRPGEVYDL